MKRWKTDKIVKLLEHEDWIVKVETPGGDWDTDNLYIRHTKARRSGALYVFGFVTGEHAPLSDTSTTDCDVEMVQVSDGEDSRGGLNSSNEYICHMYAGVVSRLRKKGFDVVPSMKDYY